MSQYQVIESEQGKSVSAVVNGRLMAANGDHPNFDRIIEGLRNGEDVEELFDLSATAARKFDKLSERVSVANGQVYLDNEVVDSALSSLIARFIRDGHDFQPLVNFFEKVQANPVEHSREQLFSWLRERDFTITSDGDFIAYKGLRSDLTSVHSGPGIVNGQETKGNLDNSPGNVIEMARSKVQFDPSVGCASGLHAGTWEYASSFGHRVVEVSVNPRDVVSVPTDCAAQKIRTCRYTVLQEVEGADVSSLRELDLDGDYDWNDDDEDWNDSGVLREFYASSDSDPNTAYLVTVYIDGERECECPAFTYRGDCKHLFRG